MDQTQTFSQDPANRARGAPASEPGLWFEEGVPHRSTGARTAFSKKAPELQAAIILAANRHGGDWWEMLKPEAQDRYLSEGRRLVTEGAYKPMQARRSDDAGASGSQDREAPPALSCTPDPEPGVLCRLNDTHCIVDDPLQWILQRSDNKGKWRPLMFFRTREGLLHYLVDEPEAGECDPAALDVLRALPECHP